MRRERDWERVLRESFMRDMAWRSGAVLKFERVWRRRVAGSSSRSMVRGGLWLWVCGVRICCGRSADCLCVMGDGRCAKSDRD